MTLLQSMEGKYYDVPEDQAASFEIPREKVKDLLAKAGPPAMTQGAPNSGRRPGPSMGGPSGGTPVIIQVLPNGVYGPAPATAGGPPSEGDPSAEGDGDVDPYWWMWRNMHYGPWWGNRWMNW